jgi:hypothetical protein
MGLREWSKSNANYGEKLVNSGIEGARCGGEAFLNGNPSLLFFASRRAAR